MGGAEAKASKNVRSTSIFKSINLLGIEAGSEVGLEAGETVILASSIDILSELRLFELRISELRLLPNLFLFSIEETFSYIALIY